MSVTVSGAQKVLDAFNRISDVDAWSILRATARDILNRGKEPGGTPVRTGQLRISLGYSEDAFGFTVGYLKEYAPYVEYGHRTRTGGFAPGQFYLKRNVEAEMPVVKQRVENAVKKAVDKHA